MCVCGGGGCVHCSGRVNDEGLLSIWTSVFCTRKEGGLCLYCPGQMVGGELLIASTTLDVCLREEAGVAWGWGGGV